MTKYVVNFEDRFDNGTTFETETTNEGEINDLAWKHAYEIANSDIKDVRWYKFVDGVVNIEPMVVISQEEYDSLKIDATKYHCLENVGVNNWNDYEYAIKEFEEITGEEWW